MTPPSKALASGSPGLCCGGGRQLAGAGRGGRGSALGLWHGLAPWPPSGPRPISRETGSSLFILLRAHLGRLSPSSVPGGSKG